MDRIEKFLLKLEKKRRAVFLIIFRDIIKLNLEKYDIKPLHGFHGIFRLRKGKIRIIFAKQNNRGYVIDIDFRKDIYK